MCFKMASIRSEIGENMEENYNEAIAEVRFNMSTIGLKEASVKRVVKARDLAIKALEKQIPKKLVKSENQVVRYVNTYYCPICNLEITGTNIAKWCYHCGQKFDWSE